MKTHFLFLSKIVRRFGAYAFAFLILASGFSLNASAQSYNLSPLWSLGVINAEFPSGHDWISTNHTHRGLAYNPDTTHLLTVSRFPETNAAVYILDSNNGSLLGELDTNGIYFGTMSNETFVGIAFPLNMIDVADDGAIFACNLTLDTTNAAAVNFGPFRIYRWENEAAPPTVAYFGDPSDTDTNIHHRRFGDSIAVRGSGVNTEILTGTRQGKILARFTTSDGINFTHQKIDAPELAGLPSTVTISFGAGNEFWIKAESGSAIERPLQHFSFDPNTATAALIEDYTNFGPGGPLVFDASRNLLAIIPTKLHELRLFKSTSIGFVQQGVSHSFATTNGNGNNTGSVAFSEDKFFALESNNGIAAFSITTNSFPPFIASISTQADLTTVTWPSVSGFRYQPQYKNSLNDFSWTNLGEATNGIDSDISIDDTLSGEARFYQIKAE